MVDEIRYLGDLQRLSLKPGDKLVLTMKGHVSVQMAENIAAQVKKTIGDVPLIVLEEGMTIGAIGSDEDGK